MEIVLQFFEDDTPTLGLAHSNSLDRGFNAFFSARGIFHDLMEHYFEDTHPNFRGEYAFNYAGEVAANGHFLWYFHGMGLDFRLESSIPIEHRVSDNVGLADELLEGYCLFGTEFKTRIRNRYKPHPNYAGTLTQHWYQWEQLLNTEIATCDLDKRNDSLRLRKSISYSKLAALYGWGYYRAKRLFPATCENLYTIKKMYKELETFVEWNDPKTLCTYFKYFKAVIKPGKKFRYKFLLVDNFYRNEHDIFEWESTLGLE